jgi:peptide/nickel transport system permease protein
MQRYLVGRVLQAVLSLFLLSVVVFVLVRLSGSPLEVLLPLEATQEQHDELARRLGLDRPLPVQYALWASHALRGDFGTALKARVPVARLLTERLANTARLAGFTMALALAVGLPLGIGAAVYRDSLIDTISRVVAVAGMSFPVFWTGIMAILVFSVHLNVLPAFGGGGIEHYILPGSCLAWTFAAPIMRLTRSSMLEALDSEYVQLARIKGVPEWWTVLGHALRNALIPVLTFAGTYLGLLLGGMVVVETVFAWPGLGLLTYEAVRWRDYATLQGTVMLLGTAVLTTSLAVDVLYSYLDPRIRY